MALQSSGAISISQIRTELGSASGSLRTLSSLAGKSTPDAMSEFWGYSAVPPNIYWDGAMTFQYVDSGAYDVYYVDNYLPEIQSIVFGYGSVYFNLATDATNGWDRYVPGDGYCYMSLYASASGSLGADRTYYYLTPPSGRSFSSTSFSTATIELVSYDVTSSVIYLEYYANQIYGFGSSVDLTFYI